MLIKDTIIDERPREKLLNYGVKSLSNEELLAIIFRTGTKSKSAKDISTILINEIGGISNLKNVTYQKLKDIKGLGEVKIGVLLASLELGKRVFLNKVKNREKMNNTTLIFEKFKDYYFFKEQEIFLCLYLDNKNCLIEYQELFKGTINQSTVHPREIFKRAYELSASSIICLHNHPSNVVLPSISDIEFTKNIKEISLIMGINFIDHIIIGKDKYYSFYEKGKL